MVVAWIFVTKTLQHFEAAKDLNDFLGINYYMSDWMEALMAKLKSSTTVREKEALSTKLKVLVVVLGSTMCLATGTGSFILQRAI